MPGTFTYVILFHILTVLRGKYYSSHYIDKQTETEKLHDFAKATLLVSSRARIKSISTLSDSILDEGLLNKSADDPKLRGMGNKLNDEIWCMIPIKMLMGWSNEPDLTSSF